MHFQYHSKEIVKLRLNEKSKVKTQGDSLNVNSQLLFQRLVTAARNITEDVSKIFEYELSNFRSSLFESSGVMREPLVDSS
jgi:hypothetical protein